MLSSKESACTAEGRIDIGRLIHLMGRHPRQKLPHLIEVACVLTTCDMDVQFAFDLDLLLIRRRDKQG